MPHGEWTMTGTNRAPGNRCFWCDRPLGNRYHKTYIFEVAKARSPNRFQHRHGKLVGFGHYVCPDCEPPEPDGARVD